MTKLATARVAAAAAAGALAWVALGAFGPLMSCAAVLDIEDPLPRGDDGSSDARVQDSSIPEEADSGPDADARDAAVLDADGATSDARLDGGAEADARIPVPDAGYTVTVPQPAPAFVDACSLPGKFSVLAGHDDAATSKVMLPFAFEFFGIPQSAYWVNSNGVMGFDGMVSNLAIVNCPLPNTSPDPYPAIFAFGDDLFFDPMGSIGVCIALTGTDPKQQLVLTWEDAQLKNYSGTSHLTFSVVLTQTTNTIDLLYGTMTGGTEAQGDKATIGLQSSTPARGYDEFSCKKAVVTTTPLDVRFTPTP